MFDYGQIIRRSIQVVKKNKWLLIYGALIAGGLGSGGGGGGGGSSDRSTNNTDYTNPEINLESIPRKTSLVLGEYTNQLKDWFAQVPATTWGLLVFAFVILLVIGICVGIILRSWAKASLIVGVQMALAEKQVNLTNTSPIGKAKTKNMIVFSLISGAMVFGTIVVFSIIGGLSYLFLKDQGDLMAIWAMLLVIPAVIIIVIGAMFLVMISIYAERLIVLENYTPWNAWKKGLTFSKGNFSGTAVMGLVNSITTGVFGCLTTIVALIILGIPSFILLVPSISNNKMPSPIVWVFLVLFVIVLLLVMTLVSAASEVFKFSNWNQVFNEVLARTSTPKADDKATLNQKA